MIDRELATKVVALLNAMVAADRCAVAAMIANRVPCSQALAEHPTVQVHAQHGGYFVGLLGLLNGLCGVDEKGWGAIAAVFDEPQETGEWGTLKGFKVLDGEAA